MTDVTVAGSPLHGWIERLATFNADAAAGGITREVYTPEYRAATDYVAGLMRAAGMRTRIDPVGNLFGLWEGTDPALPRVLTGSHFDTTLNAGIYDGVVGVLGAIEAVRGLRAADVRPRHGIEVVGFAGEEPRFGQGCTGSRALVGELTPGHLTELVDRDGVTLGEALAAAGFDPGQVTSARFDASRYSAFVELHIEQGAVLEAAGCDIGVVTHIAAPHDLRVTLRGEPMHAGATPMALRHDALACAAELMGLLEGLARDSRSGTTVATVGVIEALPGAINVIPGEVSFHVDVRDVDAGARGEVVTAFLSAGAEIAARRGVRIEHELIAEVAPATCDPAIVDAVRRSCEDIGIDHVELASGAFHDAMVIGKAMPMGMVFVPSRGGISHSPLEFTAAGEIDRGVAVLARTLARLAGATP